MVLETMILTVVLRPYNTIIAYLQESKTPRTETRTRPNKDATKSEIGKEKSKNLAGAAENVLKLKQYGR